MKKILSFVLFVAVSATAMAVPARRGGIIRTAADGTQKEVFLHGRAFGHYMTDADGNWLDEQTLQPLSQEVIQERQTAMRARAKARRSQQVTGVDRLLAPRGAVILVNYQDTKFSNTLEEMTDWAMGENYSYNGATGSIHQYFYDQSWGQYDLQIDVFGPVTVSQKSSYYGENDRRGDDKRPDELIVEACQLAHDQFGADFSQYDSNHDGYVDWVVIIYAGKGEADGGDESTIWPHQYELSYTGKAFLLDNKTVDHYCCLSELDGQTGKRNGIGTFCHEFSHVMGLPDLYETNNPTTGLHTLLSWDIMDYGPYNNNGNTPPSYSSYERWFMGWITPTLLDTTASSIILPPLNDSQAAILVTETGVNISNILNPQPTTFYLLETRKKEGWDKYLPGPGMLLTKIKFNSEDWLYNTVNNSSSAMGVDIIEAKANTTKGRLASAKATDAFPAGATSYTKITNYQITNIVLERNGDITFDVNGGGESTLLDVEVIAEEQEGSARKLLRDGQVLIERNGIVYDLNGRIVNSK